MAQNYTEQLRKDNVRDAIYEDLQNNCEVLRTSWSGNAFPANPKVGQPCYRVDEDKLYYWDGYKWSQKGGGGSAELKTMELAAATSERVSITLEGARCLDKNMMFVFVDKIAQDPSTYSMNDDGTVVNFNPAIPANAAVTLRWFDTDVGTFDTAIFASDAEFAAGELTNKAPNVKQVHSLSDQIQTSNANYVKSELQSNLLNYTTNRILEIPQDIKLELNNGTLTLKAGSKVYVPNGFEADGTTPKFDEFITSNDSVDTDFGNASKEVAFLMTKSDLANTMSVWSGKQVVSGTSAPDFSSTGYWGVWYDTSNNIIKIQDGTNEWKDLRGFSLPICLVSSSSSAVTSLDQVFNGFGYIGSTVFALPGVKVQTPNGRNEDGTYKSVIRTLDSVRTYNAGAWKTRNLNISFSGGVDSILFETLATDWFTYNKKFSSDTATVSYDEDTGLWWFSPNQSSWSQISVNIVGSCRVESGKITSFEPFTVDSIVNSNLSNLSAAGQAKFDAKANTDASNFNEAGKSLLSGLGMPSNRYIDLTPLTSGNTYTAPANGWFYVAHTATGDDGQVYIRNNDNGARSTSISRDATWIDIPVPPLAVKKGDVVAVDYLRTTIILLRFIYAEGEEQDV